MTPLGEMLRSWRPSERAMSADERALVTDDLFLDPSDRWRELWRFLILIVLSTLIATLGLVANSVAVIIGAMLIAPLMTPILAASASLMLSDLRRLAVSVGVLVLGTAAAIATAFAATWIGLQTLTTADSLPSEILGRTAPSLIDLGVAIAAGLAAGYVVTHPKTSASLPGVAIAVALVPPLATVGITLQIGAAEEAQGAMLLYLTNLVAIVLSAIVVMLASGFIPPELRLEGLRSARIGLIVSLFLLILIAVPLTLHTLDVVRDLAFARAVARQVTVWDPNSTIVELRADAKDDRGGEVDLVVATTSSSAPPAWQLADLIAEDTGKVVAVSVRYRLEERDAATSG